LNFKSFYDIWVLIFTYLYRQHTTHPHFIQQQTYKDLPINKIIELYKCVYVCIYTMQPFIGISFDIG